MSSEAVFEWLDAHREELVTFLLELATIKSPRGYEREASDFLYRWLVERGLDARTQAVIGDRENVIATLPGTGSGRNLLYNGHLDTAYGAPEQDEWLIGTPDPIYTEAWREGDRLYGDDVVNDKGPTAAFLWAGLALAECGVELGGDLSLTGVVGETPGATIDEFQDADTYVGNGVGARRLVEGGIDPDLAVVAERSDHTIGQMSSGVVWFKVVLTGTTAYTPKVPDIPATEPRAIRRLMGAVEALEAWEPGYREAHTREYDHGTNRPTAGVGAVRSGHPTHAAKLPGKAALYLDVRLPPGAGPELVRGEVEGVLREAAVGPFSVEPYMFRRGYIADQTRVGPLVEALTDAHERVRGGPPARPSPSVTSSYRDMNAFNEVGIPTVSYGPSRPHDEGSVTKAAYSLPIDDLLDTAKIYAYTAMRVCAPP